MYQPPQFKSADPAIAAELMRRYPFASLVSTDDGGFPYVTHLPLHLEEQDGGFVLWGHCAKPNAHWRYLQARPQVGLTFASSDKWVSVHGTATLVDDKTKLEELWNTFAEAWLPGGPDDDKAALIRVDLDGGEYWDSPGGRVASLISFVKTKITGDTYDTDTGSADL